MAKSGLSFFPLDCQLDDKFELIEAEFGLKGFAVIIKLLQRIYGGEGYYCNWTEEVVLLFSKDTLLSEGAVSEIVKAAVRRGIFSEELFEEHSILTSRGIQKRYVYGCSRKQKVELKKEYLLLEVDDLRKNVCIIDKNVNKNSKNAHIQKQTKQDETRLYETRQDETKQDGDSGGVFTIFEKCGFQITSHNVDELNVLSEKYTNEWLIEAIKRSADRGKRTISYIKGILSNWETAGAMDDTKKPDQDKGSTEAQKQASAEKRRQSEQEADAIIEQERKVMLEQAPEVPKNLNYNFFKKV